MSGNTFPINKADLPTLKTRRALLVIDVQNDFLSEGAPLYTAEPEGFVDRISNLVAAFRPVGDILWVRSEYKRKQLHNGDDILVSDEPLMPLATRSRRRSPVQPVAISDPEAFLGVDEPKESLAARPGTPGADFYSPIESSIDKTRDRCFTKSHYSAFQSGELIKLLRTRFVTELFLVGSLVNVGVFATAVDAASHGYEITVVEDCCGFRSASRQVNALRRVVELTGCEVALASKVIGKIIPEAVGPKEAKPRDDTPTAQAGDKVDDDTLTSQLQKLSLENKKEKGGEDVAGRAQPDTSPDLSTQPQNGAGRNSSAFDGNLPDEKLDSEKKESLGDDSNKERTDDQKIDATSTEVPAEQRAIVQENTKQVQADVKDTTPPSSTLEAKPTSGATESSERNGISQTKPSAPESKSQQPSDKAPMEAQAKTPETICEGDTSIIHNILPVDRADEIFEKLKSEVEWAHMSHQGGEVPRLVAVQGEVGDDGSQPIYRHPSDESPPLSAFSPTVRIIKEKVEKELKHPLNHVLIQWYRTGHDYINEHSDKTLDIVPGSYIANVSLGAQRTMTLRTKKKSREDSTTDSSNLAGTKRNIVRVPLPHNSLFRMGLKTNEKWLHGIKQDRRHDRDKTEPELAFDSARISLTFRHIGTFMDAEGKLIWGQGATSKTREGAKQVVNGQTPEAVKMLQGFGTENHSSDFDWQNHYGGGFDVLHMSVSPRLFGSYDKTVNHRVQFMLAELGISYARGSVATGSDEEAANPEGIQIKFVDNDEEHSVVAGEAAIMLYLELVYNKDRCARSNTVLGKELSRFNQAFELLRWFRASEDKKENQGRKVKKALSAWNNYVDEEEQGFVAGKTITIADYAFFPVLCHIREVMGKKVLASGLEGLEKYYTTLRARPSAIRVMGPIEDEVQEAAGELRDKNSEIKEADKDESTKEVLAEAQPTKGGSEDESKDAGPAESS